MTSANRTPCYRESPATALLLATYIGLFIAMWISQRGLAWTTQVADFGRLSDRMLIEFGAIDSKEILGAGQYWRLITATLLHASIVHLFFNGFALYQLGRVLEDWFGGAMFLFLHLLLGLAGNAASVLYHAGGPRFLQVGASGALFGFIALLAMVALHARTREGRRLLWIMIFWIVFGLSFGVYVGADNVAHLGGAIAGAMVGNFEILLRPRLFPRSAARMLALATVLCFVSAFSLEAIWALGQPKQRPRAQPALVPRLQRPADQRSDF